MQINTDYAEICRQLCIIKSGNLSGESRCWRRSSSNRKIILRAPPRQTRSRHGPRSGAEHGTRHRSRARSQSRSPAPSTARSQGPEPNRGRGYPAHTPGGQIVVRSPGGTETIYIINLHVGIPETHPSKSKKKQSTGQCLDMTLAGVLIF